MAFQPIPGLATRRTMLRLGSLLLKALVFLPLPLLWQGGGETIPAATSPTISGSIATRFSQSSPRCELPACLQMHSLTRSR